MAKLFQTDPIPVFLKCSGDGIVVNLPPQSEINGTPDIFVSSVASTGGCTVNFAAGEGVLNGSGGGTTDSIQVQGSQGMKPLGDGIWILSR